MEYNASPTEGIVGVLEWARGTVVGYVWGKGLVNSVNLAAVFRFDAGSTRFHRFRLSKVVSGRTGSNSLHLEDC